MILQTGKRNSNCGLTPLQILQSTRNAQFVMGLTLVELLIVIVIVSILLSVSVPLFRNTFLGLQLNETANNIASAVRYCYASSVAESIVYMLSFDFQQNIYYISKQDASTEEFHRVSGRFGKTVKIPTEIKIEGETEDVYFYPDGKIDKVELVLKTNVTAFKIETGNAGVVRVSRYETK